MINYIIQVLLYQAIFLALYDFILQKETFFKWNRQYLLASPFLSLIIPLLRFESIQKAMPQEYLVQLPKVFLNPQVVIEKYVISSNSIDYVSIVFYIGVCVFTALFLVKLIKIIYLIRSNTNIKRDNHRLVILEKRQSAFSFFNYIFISKQLKENKKLNIIQHELVHCKQKHTVDLLVFELLKIVMWFNPLIYIFQKRITLLHEYISDTKCMEKNDKLLYFNSLLAETFNVENISFINQFFKQSFIKKRIIMITKEKSQRMKQIKYLLLIPLLTGMLFYASCNNQEEYELKDGSKVVYEVSDWADEKQRNNKERKIVERESVSFATIEDVPVFPGCEGTKAELRACLQERITSHINKNFNFGITKGLTPGIKRIFVMFEINKEGVIENVLARAPHKELQDEAIRIVKLLPKMTPGMMSGIPSSVKYSLPIAFKID